MSLDVRVVLLLFLLEVGQRDNSKYRKIFIGFIATINQGRAIRWGKVISDTLWYQLAYFGSSRLFYMDFYLVYLLLHGKVRSKQLADERYLVKKEFPIWRSYPKWWYYNKVRHFYKRNDLQEYEIYKEEQQKLQREIETIVKINKKCEQK